MGSIAPAYGCATLALVVGSSLLRWGLRRPNCELFAGSSSYREGSQPTPDRPAQAFSPPGWKPFHLRGLRRPRHSAPPDAGPAQPLLLQMRRCEDRAAGPACFTRSETMVVSGPGKPRTQSDTNSSGILLSFLLNDLPGRAHE